jgi:glutathione S-transferase
MKLYYSPGACSLAPHIVAREAQIALELEKVDIATKRTERGANFLEINPKGSVPVLGLSDGERLTEGPAIAQYLLSQLSSSESQEGQRFRRRC